MAQPTGSAGEHAEHIAAFDGKSASGISFSDEVEYRRGVVRQKSARQIARAWKTPTCGPMTTLRSTSARPATAAISQSPFGDDPGNAPLNFADLKPGKRIVYGVPFEVIDDAGAGGKSMVMAGPSGGREQRRDAGEPEGRLPLLLRQLRGLGGLRDSTAEYVVHYKDGTSRPSRCERLRALRLDGRRRPSTAPRRSLARTARAAPT